jgi:hypothetical protein
VAPSPGSSTLLGETAAISRPADQRDPFPIYTLLRNAGLSEADTLEVGDLLLRRIRSRLAKKALADGPVAAALYQNDMEVRKRTNELLVAEEIAKIDFSRYELRTMDKSLHLGLAPKPEKGPVIAKTRLPDGTREDFVVLERPTLEQPGPVVLKSRKDGRVHRNT